MQSGPSSWPISLEYYLLYMYIKYHYQTVQDHLKLKLKLWYE